MADEGRNQVTLSVFIKNVNADNLKVDIAQRSVRSDGLCGKDS